jgi:hypothetical protein
MKDSVILSHTYNILQDLAGKNGCVMSRRGSVWDAACSGSEAMLLSCELRWIMVDPRGMSQGNYMAMMTMIATNHCGWWPLKLASFLEI